MLSPSVPCSVAQPCVLRIHACSSRRLPRKIRCSQTPSCHNHSSQTSVQSSDCGCSSSSQRLAQTAAGSQDSAFPKNHEASSLASPLALGVAVGALAFGLHAPDAAASIFREEPSNALSFPTWVIHVSSVAEWVAAMGLMWQYAEVTGNERWKGMTWGMIPLLGGALAACTWHFFYNSPELDWLVAVQAGLTVAGNFTVWLAAYRIYAASQMESQSQQEK